MSFNLRVVEHRTYDKSNPTKVFHCDYLVHAVYYDDITRRPNSFNCEPETCNGLEVADHIREAWDKPVALWVDTSSVLHYTENDMPAIDYTKFGFFDEKEIKFAPGTPMARWYDELPVDDFIHGVRVWEHHLINGRVDLAIERLVTNGWFRAHAVNLCVKYMSVCKDTILFGPAPLKNVDNT